MRVSKPCPFLTVLWIGIVLMPIRLRIRISMLMPIRIRIGIKMKPILIESFYPRFHICQNNFKYFGQHIKFFLKKYSLSIFFICLALIPIRIRIHSPAFQQFYFTISEDLSFKMKNVNAKPIQPMCLHSCTVILAVHNVGVLKRVKVLGSYFLSHCYLSSHDFCMLLSQSNHFAS